MQALKDQTIVTPPSIVKAVCATGSSASRHDQITLTVSSTNCNYIKRNIKYVSPATPDYLLSKKIFESIKEQAEKDGLAGKSLFGKVFELEDADLFILSLRKFLPRFTWI